MRLYAALLLMFFVFRPFGSHAGVTTVQQLNFGEFLSYNNDSQYDITVNTNGSYSFDSGGFVEIAAPQEGVYDLDGMTPNTAITGVAVTQSSALSFGISSFDMINFQEVHSGSTDGSGVARVTIGATARTTGNGLVYADKTYSGVVNIQINF